MKSGNIWNLGFLKIGFQTVQFSKGPTIQKQDHSKSRHFSLDFKWFLTKWWWFVWISNGWASRFQTICKPTSFWPFKIKTCPDFRFLLYLYISKTKTNLTQANRWSQISSQYSRKGRSKTFALARKYLNSSNYKRFKA